MTMQPTWMSGLISCAIFVTDADATSSWWIAWYLSWSDSLSFGVQIPPDSSGSCMTALISLNVSQYLTRCPYRSNSTRAYRS